MHIDNLFFKHKRGNVIRTMLLFSFFFSDFNQDGKPDNISFMIKRVKVHSNPDPSYKFLGNYGVEKFLEIFSGKLKSTKSYSYIPRLRIYIQK